MRPPLFIRHLTATERQQAQARLRSREAFTARRRRILPASADGPRLVDNADDPTTCDCRILPASADGPRPARIARNLGCSTGTVRNAINASHREGMACLEEKSSRPHSARAFLDERFKDPLKDLPHHSPRTCGQPASLWTLDLLAEVCRARGWTPRQLTGEAIRVALKRPGIRWKRAKQWITGPDPAYVRKKKARERLIRPAATHPDWVLGFADETWWSRPALPRLHAWTDDEPLHPVERGRPREDLDPEALSCDGPLRGDTGGMLPRFVEGRPVSQAAEDFLARVCDVLAAEGKTALLLVWDNASWHISQRVRAWIRAHNGRAKREGGVRIVACRLPVKSPWLNPIEPKGAHGKRAVAEPERLPSAQEIKDRVCDYYACEQTVPLQQKVA
jgi:transposase